MYIITSKVPQTKQIISRLPNSVFTSTSISVALCFSVSYMMQETNKAVKKQDKLRHKYLQIFSGRRAGRENIKFVSLAKNYLPNP